VIPAGRGARDLEHADLGARRRRHGAAQRIGQELMPQADPQERHAALDRLAHRGLLGHQPGILVLLPDVHVAAHGQEGVVAGKVRNRHAEIEADRLPADAVRVQQAAEDAGIRHGHVLEHQDLGLSRRHDRS
jgi:hypothetical protein